MNTCPIQDAKARFSEFFDACISEGPQVVSHRGIETAILVSLSEGKYLQSKYIKEVRLLPSFARVA